MNTELEQVMMKAFAPWLKLSSSSPSLEASRCTLCDRGTDESGQRSWRWNVVYTEALLSRLYTV